MRTPAIWAFTLACFLTGACSTTRLSLEPIESRREVPLTYRTGWELGALQPGSRAGEPADDVSYPRVRVHFVRLSIAESQALFGPIGARPAALEVAPEHVDRLLAAIQGQRAERLVDVGSVAIEPERGGEIRVAKQRAYVAAFELSQTAEAAIADPIVQVTEDGYLLRLTAPPPVDRAAGDPCATTLDLEVELVLSQLEQPMRERVIELPGSSIPVTVQDPAWMTQCIQTSAPLSERNALLIAGIPARELGQTLLVVLRRE